MKLSSEQKIRLFYEMLRIRRVEETIADRYAEQQMRCPVHLSIGQEAVAVGVSAALSPGDFVMSTHRAHAHYLARGGNLKAMIAELYGRATGCTSGRGGSMHLIDLSVGMLGSTPIVGGSLPVAVGSAFASWMDGQNHVTAYYFGEGMTEEGVFAESINFAALKKLPILFVCENNLYSVYSPMEVRQPAERSRANICAAHGIWTRTGHGNRVEEVLDVAREALSRIRSGEGPAYIELDTYRWREHCGPNYDNHIGYRTEEEFQKWKKICPIDTTRDELMRAGILSDGLLKKMHHDIESEITAAFEFALSSPYPEAGTLAQHLYATSLS